MAGLATALIDLTRAAMILVLLALAWALATVALAFLALRRRLRDSQAMVWPATVATYRREDGTIGPAAPGLHDPVAGGIRPGVYFPDEALARQALDALAREEEEDEEPEPSALG